ncbi:MAG TPA: DUF1592 domain-containing protein [Pirellulaceae bacterium]|jgi:hypothetical protein
MPHFAVSLLVIGAAMSCAAADGVVPAFVRDHCEDCHNAKAKEKGLDLVSLAIDPSEPRNFALWVKVHDRVQKGEMPPADAKQPRAETRRGFIAELSKTLIAADQERIATEGRATRRRMNRYEYENTLRDLLSLPYLRVKDFLPEDSLAYGSNKVGEALDVSHVQMSRYLSAADYALRQALAPQAEQPPAATTRYYAWDQRSMYKKAGPPMRDTFMLSGYDVLPPRPRRSGGGGGFASAPAAPSVDPAEREKESVAILTSTYEPTEIQFNNFRAPFTARYRLKFSGFTIWMATNYQKTLRGHTHEPVSIYADATPAIYRKLGSFDVGPDPTVRTIDAWMMAGETIRPDAARLPRSRPPDFKNPFAEADGMPGVAFQWMEVEGPLYDEWPPAGHKLLFGELALETKPAPPPPADDETAGSGFRRRRSAFIGPPGVNVVSQDSEADAERLLRGFLEATYHRPAEAKDRERFGRVIRAALADDFSFSDAMIAGYTAVLSSPALLYFDQRPGQLSDRALAERLSYFLWNTRPDEQLLRRAVRGELHQPEVLREETERLLADPRSRQFVDAFLDFWLDLRMIVATSPDTSLYPDYDLDDLLTESMVEETQTFIGQLICENLSVSNLIDSDFAMLNERLAAHYGIAGVEGVQIRRFKLPEGSVRGGLLTQGSLLKVTANGTTTSPVVRGAWVMDRLLGQPPPPPPEAVPAVDPDVRGATTIRLQLEKHREIESCNACHKHIDPAGLALENFDVMGSWRTNYRSLGDGQPVSGVGHNGLRFRFKSGPEVDPSGELADGRRFENIRDLKQCLLRDSRQVARNLLERLVVYATGAPIGFSDRQTIEQILTRQEPAGFRVRELIHEVVQSELFTHK